MSNNCTFLGFLDFSDTQRHLQDFKSCFASSSSCVSFFRSLIVVISYFVVSMATKGSIFSPILAASTIITLKKLVAYPHCTQASKSSSIAFVAQTDNASTCLSHSSRPWILDYGAFDHLSDNKNIFLLLPLLFYPWLL